MNEGKNPPIGGSSVNNKNLKKNIIEKGSYEMSRKVLLKILERCNANIDSKIGNEFYNKGFFDGVYESMKQLYIAEHGIKKGD